MKKKILASLVFKSIVIITAFSLIVSVSGFVPVYKVNAVEEENSSVQTDVTDVASALVVSNIAIDKLDDASVDETDVTSDDALPPIGSAIDPVPTTGTIVIHKNVIGSNSLEVADNTSFNVNLNDDQMSALRSVSENAPATFSDLQPGSYTVNEEQYAGYTTFSYSSDSDLNQDGAQVKVIAGQTTVVEIVNKQNGADPSPSDGGLTLKGMKFNDSNSDGVMSAGEKGLEGWTITLTSTGPNADSNLISTSVVTGANGEYSFSGLPRTSGREFKICEESRKEWQQNLPSSKTEGATSCDNGTSGYIHINAESDPLVIAGMNFGNSLKSSEIEGSISGTVFFDRNSSQSRDEGDDGLDQWTIILRPIDIQNSVLQMTTTSDSNGHYSFSNLTKGTYEICEVRQDPVWIQTFPTVDQADCEFGNGYRVSISDDADAGASLQLVSAPSVVMSNLDFGNKQQSSGGGGNGGGGGSGTGGISFGAGGPVNNGLGSVLGASTGPDDSTDVGAGSLAGAPGFPSTGNGGEAGFNLAILLGTLILFATGLNFLTRNKQIAVR